MDHKNLDVWKQSVELVTLIYKLTQSFPEIEKYGIVNQMRRAAVSIPSNIAEGAARHSNAQFLQFLYYSVGSLSEIETQLIISNKLGYLNDIKPYQEDIEKIRRPLFGLIKYLNSKKQ